MEILDFFFVKKGVWGAIFTYIMAGNGYFSPKNAIHKSQVSICQSTMEQHRLTKNGFEQIDSL